MGLVSGFGDLTLGLRHVLAGLFDLCRKLLDFDREQGGLQRVDLGVESVKLGALASYGDAATAALRDTDR